MKKSNETETQKADDTPILSDKQMSDNEIYRSNVEALLRIYHNPDDRAREDTWNQLNQRVFPADKSGPNFAEYREKVTNAFVLEASKLKSDLWAPYCQNNPIDNTDITEYNIVVIHDLREHQRRFITTECEDKPYAIKFLLLFHQRLVECYNEVCWKFINNVFKKDSLKYHELLVDYQDLINKQIDFVEKKQNIFLKVIPSRDDVGQSTLLYGYYCTYFWYHMGKLDKFKKSLDYQLSRIPELKQDFPDKKSILEYEQLVVQLLDILQDEWKKDFHLRLRGYDKLLGVIDGALDAFPLKKHSDKRTLKELQEMLTSSQAFVKKIQNFETISLKELGDLIKLTSDSLGAAYRKSAEAEVIKLGSAFCYALQAKIPTTLPILNILKESFLKMGIMLTKRYQEVQKSKSSKKIDENKLFDKLMTDIYYSPTYEFQVQKWKEVISEYPNFLDSREKITELLMKRTESYWTNSLLILNGYDRVIRKKNIINTLLIHQQYFITTEFGGEDYSKTFLFSMYEKLLDVFNEAHSFFNVDKSFIRGNLDLARFLSSYRPVISNLKGTIFPAMKDVKNISDGLVQAMLSFERNALNFYYNMGRFDEADAGFSVMNMQISQTEDFLSMKKKENKEIRGRLEDCEAFSKKMVILLESENKTDKEVNDVLKHYGAYLKMLDIDYRLSSVFINTVAEEDWEKKEIDSTIDVCQSLEEINHIGKVEALDRLDSLIILTNRALIRADDKNASIELVNTTIKLCLSWIKKLSDTNDFCEMVIVKVLENFFHKQLTKLQGHYILNEGSKNKSDPESESKFDSKFDSKCDLEIIGLNTTNNPKTNRTQKKLRLKFLQNKQNKLLLDAVENVENKEEVTLESFSEPEPLPELAPVPDIQSEPAEVPKPDPVLNPKSDTDQQYEQLLADVKEQEAMLEQSKIDLKKQKSDFLAEKQEFETYKIKIQKKEAMLNTRQSKLERSENLIESQKITLGKQECELNYKAKDLANQIDANNKKEEELKVLTYSVLGRENTAKLKLNKSIELEKQKEFFRQSLEEQKEQIESKNKEIQALRKENEFLKADLSQSYEELRKIEAKETGLIAPLIPRVDKILGLIFGPERAPSVVIGGHPRDFIMNIDLAPRIFISYDVDIILDCTPQELSESLKSAGMMEIMPNPQVPEKFNYYKLNEDDPHDINIDITCEPGFQIEEKVDALDLMINTFFYKRDRKIIDLKEARRYITHKDLVPLKYGYDSFPEDGSLIARRVQQSNQLGKTIIKADEKAMQLYAFEVTNVIFPIYRAKIRTLFSRPEALLNLRSILDRKLFSGFFPTSTDSLDEILPHSALIEYIKNCLTEKKSFLNIFGLLLLPAIFFKIHSAGRIMGILESTQEVIFAFFKNYKNKTSFASPIGDEKGQKIEFHPQNIEQFINEKTVPNLKDIAQLEGIIHQHYNKISEATKKPPIVLNPHAPQYLSSSSASFPSFPSFPSFYSVPSSSSRSRTIPHPKAL